MACIENHKYSIEEAFRECFYIVPDYQREYVWTDNAALCDYEGKPFEFVRKVIRNVEHYLAFANGLGNDGKPSLAMDSLKRLAGGAFSLHYVLLLAAANFPNPRQCWVGCEVLLRRNREWAASENGKRPETGVSGAAASFAARPEPAPALGETGKKKPTESGWFYKCWWWILTANGTEYLHSCRYVPIEVGISRLGRGHMREPLTFSLR